MQRNGELARILVTTSELASFLRTELCVVSEGQGEVEPRDLGLLRGMMNPNIFSTNNSQKKVVCF